MNYVKAFAPATSANVGPGFDVMGIALSGIGDVVEAKRIDERKVIITEIIGNSRIPTDPDENTAGIAASEVLKLVGATGGIEMRIRKGIPLASGMGGSAASAVAGGYAANVLYGEMLSKKELIYPCLLGEAKVSGFHCDNVAPSMLGGVTLIRSSSPVDVIKMGSVDMTMVIACPNFEMPTKQARSVLPENIPMKHFVRNMAMACSAVAAISKGDVRMLGKCMEDVVVEPVRGRLIPGYFDVKRSAMESGACGCAISGAGPSVLAITDDGEKAKPIGDSMKKAFERNGLKCTIHVSCIDNEGARLVS